LLQHDLGQPDPVGILRVLPGQAIASVNLLPLDYLRRKIALRRRTAQANSSSEDSACESFDEIR
jgi:hypothetical protein